MIINILYYLLFAIVIIATAGIIGRWITPIRLGVLGIGLVLAPTFPLRGRVEGESWWMTASALAGLLLLAADIRGRLNARRAKEADDHEPVPRV